MSGPYAARIAVLGLLVASCGAEKDPAPQNEMNPDSPQELPRESLVVYASDNVTLDLDTLLPDFTASTGVRVTLERGAAPRIVDDVINHRGSPPADVLLTGDVAGISRAADTGALRPIGDENINQAAPDFLRDPDGYWVAAGVRLAAIVYDVRSVARSDIAGYASLAEPLFADRLCLTSSSLAPNRALLGMLIEELGTRPAEIVVRGWVHNLALPVFPTQQALLEAVGSGSCKVGIVSVPLDSGDNEASVVGTLRYVTPTPAYVDIEGIGIARHATHPELAAQFIEWLLTDASAAPRLGDSDLSKLAKRNVGLAGRRAEEAAQLAERAAYR